MGYEVHIVRNEQWWNEEDGGGFGLEEWLAYIKSDRSMRLDNFAETETPQGDVIRYENEGLAVWIDYSGNEETGNQAWFNFFGGCISVKNPDAEILRKMHEIASRLDAKVVGDEGEEYGADGQVRPPAETERSAPTEKPWWKFW